MMVQRTVRETLGFLLDTVHVELDGDARDELLIRLEAFIKRREQRLVAEAVRRALKRHASENR